MQDNAQGSREATHSLPIFQGLSGTWMQLLGHSRRAAQETSENPFRGTAGCVSAVPTEFYFQKNSPAS